MSDRDAEDGQNTRLLRALLWAGVGLAPIAALLVLLGSGAPTRFGVLLVAVSVVLLGAALLIRNDPVLLRMDVEERVADEVSALRSELRGEIAAVSTMAAPLAPARAAVTPARAPGYATGGRAAVRPEPGHTTGGRAAVRSEPGAMTGGRVASAAVRPPSTGSVGGRATAPAPLDPAYDAPDPGYAAPDYDSPTPGYTGAGFEAPESRYAAPGYETDDPGYTAPDPAYSPHGFGSAHPSAVPESFEDDGMAPAAHRVPSAPGWPEARPRPGGRATVGAAAPVPGQRARAAVTVPPPMAPVFQPPAAPRTYGAPRDQGGPNDQGGRRRADVTAVDLGYTGRRAKPDHAADHADWSASYGDPEPGYPGWVEADEHHRADADPLNGQYGRRGRGGTGGW